jgi:hypothetical protein
MKKIFLSLAFVLAAMLNLSAQTTDCYNEYYAAFRDRGAKKVPDGVNEVIVSIRIDGQCKCFVGKITVTNGKPVNDLMLLHEDGTYTKFEFTPHPKYARSESTFKNYISNGMSPTYLSVNDELINLFFIKALNDKPAQYKTAPPVN